MSETLVIGVGVQKLAESILDAEGSGAMEINVDVDGFHFWGVEFEEPDFGVYSFDVFKLKHVDIEVGHNEGFSFSICEDKGFGFSTFDIYMDFSRGAVGLRLGFGFEIFQGVGP